MVKNLRLKGNRAVKELIDSLGSRGWRCEVVEKSGRFVKVKDLFGLWDLLCIHPDYKPKLIQVTCNRFHYPLSDWVEFADVYGYWFSCELWKKMDYRKGFDNKWVVRILDKKFCDDYKKKPLGTIPLDGDVDGA